MNKLERSIYEFGPFRLDPAERQFSRAGEPVPLTPKAFDTLLALVRRGGSLVEKDKLMREVWPDSFVEEINLTVNISTLRKTLGENGDGGRYIETVPKRGYRFVAPVRQIFAEDEPVLLARRTRASVIIKEVEEEHETVQEQMPVPRREAKKWDGKMVYVSVSILAGCAVLVSLLAAVSYLRAKSRGGEVTTAVKPQIRSIAVLPFRPMMPGKDEDVYLGMGIADNLIKRLGYSKQITVRPINAVLKYNAPTQNPLAAGRELGVEAVLDGRIQKSGERIWISVHLVSTSDGAPLWTEKFDEPFTDILLVQDSLAERLITSLSLTLDAQQKQLLNKHGTENTEAYEAYIKGRYFWNKRSADGYRKAYDYFQQAIKIDPKYAQAYAGLADAYLLEPDVLPKGGHPKVYALKAFELDNMLAEAHTSLAYIMSAVEWNWAGADAEFRRAIDLNPNYVTAHHWYAYHLVSMGRLEEALAEIKRAREIDPLSPIINTDVGHILYFSKRYDEAVEQYHKVLEMESGFSIAHWRLGEVLLQNGMFDEAIAELLKAREMFGSDNPNMNVWLGYAYAVSGRREKALKLFRRVKENLNPDYGVAIIRAGLGEKDQAFAALREACRAHSAPMAVYKVEPMFAKLRSDPRHTEVLRCMNLAP